MMLTLPSKALKAEWAAVKLAFPVIFLSLLNTGCAFISVLYAGRVDKDHLDGVGLSNTMWSTFVFAFTAGYATVFDTYGPQVYGSKRKQELSTVALKCVAQGTIIFLFALGPYLNTVYIIDALPDNQDATERVGSAFKDVAKEYLRMTAIGGYLLYLTKIMANFLAIQNQTKFVYVIAAISFSSHVILNYILVERLSLGTTGLAAATMGSGSITVATAALICFLMIRKGILVWAGISGRIFENWVPMIKLGLSGVVSLMTDIGLFEVATFLSQFDGSTVLSTFIIQFRIITISFAPCIGVSYAAAVFIGKALSKGNLNEVRLHMKLAMFNIVSESLFLATVVYLIRKPVTILFTDDENVVETSCDTFWMLSLLLPLDHIQAMLSRGILVPFGKQRYIAISMGAVVSCVGLPIVALTIFLTDLKVAGMYICYLSYCCLLVIAFALRIWKLNLEEEISAAAVRVRESAVEEEMGSEKRKVDALGTVNLAYKVDEEAIVDADEAVCNPERLQSKPSHDINRQEQGDESTLIAPFPKDTKTILLLLLASVICCVTLGVVSLMNN